jgi:hypothetical protein
MGTLLDCPKIRVRSCKVDLCPPCLAVGGVHSPTADQESSGGPRSWCRPMSADAATARQVQGPERSPAAWCRSVSSQFTVLGLASGSPDMASGILRDAARVVAGIDRLAHQLTASGSAEPHACIRLFAPCVTCATGVSVLVNRPRRRANLVTRGLGDREVGRPHGSHGVEGSARRADRGGDPGDDA